MFGFYRTLEPYQIAMLLILDWKNFLVFYIFLVALVLANKIIDKANLVMLKLFGYFMIIASAEFVHVVIYEYENPKNLLPLGIIASCLLIIIEAKSFINKLSLRAEVDLSTFSRALNEAENKLKNKIDESLKNDNR